MRINIYILDVHFGFQLWANIWRWGGGGEEGKLQQQSRHEDLNLEVISTCLWIE